VLALQVKLNTSRFVLHCLLRTPISMQSSTRHLMFISDLEGTKSEKTLVIELHTSKDDGRAVYLTGNFNNWKTADPAYQMTQQSTGRYTYTFFSFALQQFSLLEYKFVKGGWDGEELDQDGYPTENRVLHSTAGKVVETVMNWKKHESWYDPAFYPIIEVASSQFHLPQLQRRRRVSLLLPHDYYKNPAKHYPVLYLQDGQNLFEETSPYGTWGVDRQMARLAQQGKGDVIIVAIDHGGKRRIAEYSPVTTRQYGDGFGKEYARFLAETLKPYIDKNYRTLTDRANTGIGGSSMGGLVSLYAGLLYPQVYSKFIIFSPSLWLTPGMFEAFRVGPILPEAKFFFFIGGKETKATQQNVLALHKIIKERKDASITSAFRLDADATHNEFFWGRAFPEALSTLY
jgi:predicted alpha/beta superfamily hydrolase